MRKGVFFFCRLIALDMWWALWFYTAMRECQCVKGVLTRLKSSSVSQARFGNEFNEIDIKKLEILYRAKLAKWSKKLKFDASLPQVWCNRKLARTFITMTNEEMRILTSISIPFMNDFESMPSHKLLPSIVETVESSHGTMPRLKDFPKSFRLESNATKKRLKILQQKFSCL